MSKAPKPDSAHAIESLSYEQAAEQLESIIEQIEAGEIGLEKSLAEYERGMALLKHCRAILDRAEQRVAELTPSEVGEKRRG